MAPDAVGGAEAEELTDAQIEELCADLTAVREELETTLANAAEGASTVSLDQPIGRLSRMDAMQQQAMAQANRRSAQLRLEQVGAALAAIGRQDYGYCRRCEEPIGYRRLKSRPESPFCVECQRGREGG